MRTFARRGLTLAGAAGAGLALLLGTAAPAGAAVEPRATQTITIIATRSVFSLPTAPSVGTSFVGGGSLADPDGNDLGHGYSSCQVAALEIGIAPGATAQCESTFVLPDGQINLSSLRHYQAGGAGFGTTDLAVTGGTGAYATARGDGTAVRIGTTPVTYRFTLNVITG